jgi:hypothetical protein
VFLSEGVQKHYKNVLQKNRVQRFLQKNRQKNRQKNPTILFYRVFGRFSVRGFQKHHRKNQKKIHLTPVLFWPLTYLPTHGGPVPDFFWGGCGPGPSALGALALALAVCLVCCALRVVRCALRCAFTTWVRFKTCAPLALAKERRRRHSALRPRPTHCGLRAVGICFSFSFSKGDKRVGP